MNPDPMAVQPAVRQTKERKYPLDWPAFVAAYFQSIITAEGYGALGASLPSTMIGCRHAYKAACDLVNEGPEIR